MEIGPRRSVFFLPKGAIKTLSDVGWEFVSAERLPEAAVIGILDSLGLQHHESFLGIDIYRDAECQANIQRDAIGNIESVFFQCRKSNLPQLIGSLKSVGEGEVFVPSAD